jgi:alkanesulfonate monooxygenase SsuD/methylene tetrahydromethanopterin reductase-like flavin-dependent oxidoreductase (luciferase family)
MTMPVMEPNLDAATLKAWARVIDGGPFSSLCWGERIAFDNPECLTLLGALSAWTDRVRLVTTVVVPQLHDPVMLAKQLATGDMLRGGRLTVGVGVGGRDEDYHAVGACPSTRTMRGLADSVAVMKRIWAGEKVTESVVPVGPSPVQTGGPELLIGTMGPKTVRSAAAWADGLAGTTLDLDVDKQNELFEVARQSWAQAGKRKPPSGHVVLVRHRRRRSGHPCAGTSASAALHELDPAAGRRCDGADDGLGRHRRRTPRPPAPVCGDRQR